MTQTRKPVVANSVLLGDCLEWLRRFPDHSFSAVLTDPPYGLSSQPDMREVLTHWLAGDDYEHSSSGFMGKSWDSFVPDPKVWAEVFRVLKPGGHVLSFSGTRCYDLMVTAMRLASFEVRDKIDYYHAVEQTGYRSWAYGQGFPKSHNIGNAVDKALGCGNRGSAIVSGSKYHPTTGEARRPGEQLDKYEGRTKEGKLWSGYGTALKPAAEPLAQFSKANEDGSMPESPDAPPFSYHSKSSRKDRNCGCKWMRWVLRDGMMVHIRQDEYEALKAENETRKGEEGFTPHRLTEGNNHPTVKSLSLCRYLVKMVKMPGDNLILDPFCGSGSILCAAVLEGCDYIGIDSDPMSVELSEARTRYFRCLGEKGLK